MLEIKYIKKFPEKTMDISFRSERAMTVFFGRSGAGKSVTLRSIAGLVVPDSGTIKVGDKVYFDSKSRINLTPQERRTGYVFQSYALFPHLTVAENLLLAMKTVPKRETRYEVRELLEEVGIPELHDRLPGDLSGGEQQRVALARALARNPQVLLLDEPFSAVDVPSRVRLRTLLKRVQRHRNIPTILVTHQALEAFTLGELIVVMDHGKVEQVGPPEEIFYRPKTLTTARLVGVKNIFPGVISEISQDTVYIKQNGKVWEAASLSGLHLSPDQRVSWCIRPEAVMLLREDRPLSLKRENRLSGVIEEVEQRGPVWELFVVSKEGMDLKIELPVHAAQHMGVTEGKEVLVSLKKEAIHIIPEIPDSGF